jgi:hypothetical protein
MSGTSRPEDEVYARGFHLPDRHFNILNTKSEAAIHFFDCDYSYVFFG